MNQEILRPFIELFTLTDQDATGRIAGRLELVLRAPAAYQKEFAEELVERGMEGGLPAQELRDVALIDALLSEELIWECDWQDSGPDTAEALNELLAHQNRVPALHHATLASFRKAGPEMLDALQDALEPAGLALALFALDSDSFPLSVVAEAQAESARQQAQELGFTLTIY